MKSAIGRMYFPKMDDTLPAENREYKDMEYWDQRYENDTSESFDWFKSFKDLPILTELIKKTDKILHVGCGNSTLPVDMHQYGFKNIINLDYSKVLIQKMSQKYPELNWVEGDIFNLEAFKDFDVVLDKGTLDALLTVPHDQWNPEPELLSQIHLYLEQVLNVLKPGGKFIQITFGQPHFRTKFLTMFDTKVHTLEANGVGFDYFIYECTKK